MDTLVAAKPPDKSDETQKTCYIRILNASPDSDAVSIYISGELFVSGLPYRGFTEYHAAKPGYYDFSVSQTGYNNTHMIMIDERIEFLPFGIYTIAVTGTKNDLDFTIIHDFPKSPKAGKACVRFVNLSPYNTSFDITLNDYPVIDGLEYTEISRYAELNPGTYNLKIYSAGDDVLLMTNPKMTLSANKYFGVYVIGFTSQSPKLQVLVPLEGATYINHQTIK